MAFKKIMLVHYTPAPLQALHTDGWDYTLTVRVSTWWGLYVRLVKYDVTVPMNVSADEFYSDKIYKWIKNPKKLKK